VEFGEAGRFIGSAGGGLAVGWEMCHPWCMTNHTDTQVHKGMVRLNGVAVGTASYVDSGRGDGTIALVYTPKRPIKLPAIGSVFPVKSPKHGEGTVLLHSGPRSVVVEFADGFQREYTAD